jgi:hypothetical protein
VKEGTTVIALIPQRESMDLWARPREFRGAHEDMAREKYLSDAGK